MKDFPFPIRYSIPLILLVFVLVLCSFLFVREVLLSRAGIEASLQEDARFTGIQTATILENLYQRELNHVALSVVSQLAVKPYLTRALIIDENNRVISSTAYEQMDRQLDPSMITLPVSEIDEARQTLSSIVTIDRHTDTLTAVYPFMLSIKPGFIRADKTGILYFEYDMALQKKDLLMVLSRIFFESFLIFFILCAAVFFFLNKTISLRVYRLLDAARRLARGDFKVRSTLKGSDELADISRAFDLMADQIEIKNHELEKANDELEQRVEQRTAELKRLADQLSTAKEAAEAANEAKSQFLARMSHEIRTPMHAIMSMTGFALKGELPDKQKGYLQVVKEASENLLVIINDILDFSKIEAGMMEIESVDFDLHHCLDTVIKKFQLLADQKNISLKMTVSEHTPQFVRGDPVRFSQVLTNLISNAIKFTETGGVNVYVKPSEEGRISFSVNDTGIGISEDKLPLVFESFTQADNSTTRKYGGTGLGLPISKQLVELMGGEITVTSKHGAGSSFVFTVCFKEPEFKEPLSEEYDQKVIATADDLYERRLNILLAEDDPVNVQVALVFISDMGWTMKHADNGKEALRLLSEERFDLVLMDVSMPDMDGLEACSRLRRGEAGDKNRHIPVVAMTAHALTGFKERCLEAGMTDYISKPVDFTRLKYMISCLTGSGVAHAEAPQDETDTSVDRCVVLNFQDTLKRLNGNMDIFRKLLSIYVSKLPEMMEEIGQAIEKGGFEETAKIAHKYKGSSSTIGADRIVQAIQEIESGAKDGKPDRVGQYFAALKSEVVAFEAEVKAI